MSDKKITPEVFKAAVGREPTEDELAQVNCEIVGIPGHTFCGWCEEHDKPRIECHCSVGDVKYLHSTCCQAHWELAEYNGKLELFCEKCFKSAGKSIMVLPITYDQDKPIPDKPAVPAKLAKKTAKKAKLPTATMSKKNTDGIILPEVTEIPEMPDVKPPKEDDK